MNVRAHRVGSRRRCHAACLLLLPLLACADRREHEPPEPVYEDDIELLLQRRCGGCHASGDAGSGFAPGSYLEATACIEGERVVSPGDERALLLQVLARPDHERVVSAAERARIEVWVRGGAPLRSASIHAPSVLDPGAEQWHGRLAAVDRWGPIVDPEHAEACGRCHRGAPATPERVRHAAPGATACTDCHRQQGGVLACGTCHGSDARAYPPRAPCLSGSSGGAHRAHVSASALHAQPLACATCHPAADASLTGSHGDGHVDVRFDSELAGAQAEFDAQSGRCAVACHAQGGARARPSWDEQGRLGCGDCHGSPPHDHPAGACSQCHAEANDDGTALRSARLHMNGRVDVGDGGEGCDGCHGRDGDGWPSTGAHRLHRDTELSLPIACSDCHVVPRDIDDESHLDGEPAEVVLSGRAAQRGRLPSYEAGRCADVACHGAGLANASAALTPRWDSEPALACDGCHDVPPRIDHPTGQNCASLVCHGGEIAPASDGLRITAAGRSEHIDGHVDALGIVTEP